MAVEADALVLLALIAFLGAFVYGLTGFGSGLVTIPLASHFHELPFVLAVFALLDCVNAARLSLARPQAIVRDEVRRLVPTCIAGVVLGVALLVLLPPRMLMIALGAFVLAFALHGLLRAGAVPMVSGRWAYVAGLSGGVSSAMFGAGGPPYAIYLSMRPHAVESMRATLAVTSLVSITARIVAFGVAGLLSSWVVWIAALAVVPASLAALWCADRVHATLSREAVLTAVRLLLCLTGASLLIRAFGAG